VDFTEARDIEWQWHQLGHMQVCTSLQKDNHASTPPLSYLQTGCSSCRPTNSVKALKATHIDAYNKAIVDIRLRPRSSASPGGSVWVHATMSNSCCPIESLWVHTPFLCCLFLAIMCKHDVIHKTGSTWSIATPPKKDWSGSSKQTFGITGARRSSL